MNVIYHEGEAKSCKKRKFIDYIYTQFYNFFKKKQHFYNSASGKQKKRVKNVIDNLNENEKKMVVL